MDRLESIPHQRNPRTDRTSSHGLQMDNWARGCQHKMPLYSNSNYDNI